MTANQRHHLSSIDGLTLRALREIQAGLMTRPIPKKPGPDDWWARARLAAITKRIATLAA